MPLHAMTMSTVNYYAKKLVRKINANLPVWKYTA